MANGLKEEEWRDVVNAPGYQVSSAGNVQGFRPLNGCGPLESLSSLAKVFGDTKAAVRNARIGKTWRAA